LAQEMIQEIIREAFEKSLGIEEMLYASRE
jgi:hypothetical protein